MDWHKFKVRDYLVSTVHLADAEDLAYRRLIDLYYLTEKPIEGSLESIAQRVKLDADCVEPVLKEFFVYRDGAYHHAEIEDAIAKTRHRRAINGAAGKIGGSTPKRPRKGPTKKRSPSAKNDLILTVGRITIA